MRNVDRAFQHHRFSRMFADDSPGFHRVMIQQRRWIQLRPQQKNIVPAGQGHAGPHGAVKTLAGYRHFMDLLHVAAVYILAFILGIITQCLFQFCCCLCFLATVNPLKF